METSIRGVVGFLEGNDSLIKRLMETAESAHQEITDLAVQVDQAREEVKVLIDQLSVVEFVIENRMRRKSVRRRCWKPSPPCGRNSRPTRMTRCAGHLCRGNLQSLFAACRHL